MSTTKRGKGRWRSTARKTLKKQDALTPSEKKRVEKFKAMLIRMRPGNEEEAQRKKVRRVRKWPTK